MIEIKNYKKHYKTHEITLSNLKVFKEKLLILGENGIGKSTLLKSLASLNHFEGLINIPKPALYLPSDYPLPNHSLKTYFTWLSTYAQGLYLTWFPLDKRHLMTNELSQGMKQKLRILLAISWPVETLCLDEPFTYVDLEAKGLIIKVLQAIHQTVIITSHHPLDLGPSWEVYHWHAS